MQDEFEKERHTWLPRTDTKKHRRFDKRQSGLFKEEWRGSGIVSLCSKTYYCFGDVNKYSCKGVNKKQQKPLTASRYLDVLKTTCTDHATNRGLRMLNGHMATYSQEKEALSYLYVKRKVSEDGVSTSYLD